MAIESQGITFFWSSNGTTRSTAAGSIIGEITDFSGPGGQAAVIDITSLESTAKEKLIGLRDEGQLSISLNCNTTQAGQALLIADRAARTKKRWVIKFGDETSNEAVGEGYCLGYSISGAVDNKVSANAVIEIDGPVTYTTA